MLNGVMRPERQGGGRRGGRRLVEVFVLGAKDLPKMDWGPTGSCDPYVTVTYGAEMFTCESRGVCECGGGAAATAAGAGRGDGPRVWCMLLYSIAVQRR